MRGRRQKLDGPELFVVEPHQTAAAASVFQSQGIHDGAAPEELDSDARAAEADVVEFHLQRTTFGTLQRQHQRASPDEGEERKYRLVFAFEIAEDARGRRHRGPPLPPDYLQPTQTRHSREVGEGDGRED